MKVDVYIAADDKQPTKKERRIGYLIRAEVSGRTAEKYGTKCVDATLFKGIILTIVEILDRFKRPAEITMHLENSWIIGNLIVDNNGKRVIDMWQENGWKTARGTPVKNKNEWQRLYNKLRVFEQSGGTFEYVSMKKENKTDCESREKIAWIIERSLLNSD